MHRSFLLPMMVGLLAFPTLLHAQSDAEPSTRTVTDRYLELTFGQQYDALQDLYAADVVFEDPTADVFPGPLAEGPVEGAETVIAMQKSWGIAESSFDIRGAFTVGEYSLYHGTLTVGYAAAADQPARSVGIPFVTVHRVRNGRLAERLDFGEYIESFGLGDHFDDNTKTTREIADRYRDAYLEGDLETQAELMVDNIRFQDPTARFYGEQQGAPIEGAQTLIDRRQSMYEAVEGFDLEVEESFYANHHAVYMGTVSYTLKAGPKFVQPGVLVLEVKDGKITRHWDFVDYGRGPVQEGALEAPSADGRSEG